MKSHQAFKKAFARYRPVSSTTFFWDKRNKALEYLKTLKFYDQLDYMLPKIH